MEMGKEEEVIVVLEFGREYKELIRRGMREMGVYSELDDEEICIEEIKGM
ncbi:type 1 glutamine amidotransferase family protein, partial [Staphylococcus epidermidis]